MGTMNLVVLTTETLHHAHFVHEVAARVPAVRVFIETGRAEFPYHTYHPFEDERDAMERRLWFGDGPARVSDFVEAEFVDDINDRLVAEALHRSRPDLVIVFGTRRLRSDILTAAPDRIVNLHGGDPEQYRGLDTHLWAIWHRDFAGLVTTIHHVDQDLDTGRVIAREPIRIAKAMKLHELRAANTEACVRLALRTVEQFERGPAGGEPQQRCGRYYSAMPTALKAVCVKRFENHTKRL